LWLGGAGLAGLAPADLPARIQRITGPQELEAALAALHAAR
jgi:hypothetical protein